MTINYKNTLLSAAQITLKNKYLWFFGLFAAFLSNNAGISWRTEKGELWSGWEKLQSTQIFNISTIKGIGPLIKQDPVGVGINLLILLLILALGIFIAWLAFVSQGALISNVAKLSSGKKTNFQEGLQSGKRFFWPVFFFKIILKAISVGLLSLLALPFIINLTLNLGFWWLVLYYFITLLIVVLIFIAFYIIRYSMSYAVIKNARFIDACKNGWSLFYKNIINSIEAGAIIFLANIAIGFTIIISLFAVAIPFILVLFVFYKLAVEAAFMFILALMMIIIFVLIAWAGAVLTAFNDTFWTIFFIDLIKGKKNSLIGSLFIK